MSQLETFYIVLAAIFMVSILVSKASYRFGLPVLVLFLGVGMLFGQDGLGIQFSNYNVAEIIGTTALCIILFSGGMGTNVNTIRPVLGRGIILSTAGVLITSILTGFFIYYLAKLMVPSFHVTIWQALLLASVMSSTDSASVFSLLSGRNVKLKNNLGPLLELESGSNDPMAYLLTITLVQIISVGGDIHIAKVGISLLQGLVFGAVAGYIMGKLSVRLMNNVNLQNESLYPILLLACSFLIFSLSYFIGGNSYLAVYIGGIVIGNSKFVSRRGSINFFDGITWLCQITLFLTLGLLVSPTELLKVAPVSIMIAIFLILLGRPVSVFISLLPFKNTLQDKQFISFVGLKGAAPIVFAIIPLAAGIEGANWIFNIVFFVTIISLLIQGSLLVKVAENLSLIDTEDIEEKREFNVDFSDDIKSAMTEITVSENILAKGNNLMTLNLPDSTLAVMVKRGASYFIPKGNTELMLNDKVLVISDNEEAMYKAYEILGIRAHTLKKS